MTTTAPHHDPAARAAAARAAELLEQADALVVAAGAGMGVDSGLPDFRGDEGFWKAYPPFRGKKFYEMSNPHWFTTDPAQAWGFFGHRLHLYRSTMPHAGFAILKSNNVPNTEGAQFKILAGHSRGTAYVEQIVDVQTYKPENASATPSRACMFTAQRSSGRRVWRC